MHTPPSGHSARPAQPDAQVSLRASQRDADAPRHSSQPDGLAASSMPQLVATGVRTARTSSFVRTITGREHAEPVVLLHGNVSSSVFFEPLMGMLPSRYRPLAMDLRGFGGSDPEPVDATRGVRDFSDDVLAVLDTLGMHQAHVVGWSLGGAVAAQMAIDAPERVRTLSLLAPVSPYGFGGTHGTRGEPNSPDCAGSGAGLVSQRFVMALADHDRSERPAGPRAMLRHFYLGGALERGGAASGGIDEDELVVAMLSTVLGPENYPGDVQESTHWPGSAPGKTGVMNALSPLYLNQAALAVIDPKPPILWVRGDQDGVISNESGMDVAVRGAAGAVPDYPGAAVIPPQPMVSQTRAVLADYAAAGGYCREMTIVGAGHAPHLTHLPELLEVLVAHLDGATEG